MSLDLKATATAWKKLEKNPDVHCTTLSPTYVELKVPARETFVSFVRDLRKEKVALYLSVMRSCTRVI